MSHERSSRFEVMDPDDFEAVLADRRDDGRWELIGGRVVRMMVGARWQHDVIVQNLAGARRQRFGAQGSDCRTFTETFFRKASSLQTTTLPDIVVRGGRLDDGTTCLDDPRVLVEVASPGSAARDRVEKWKVYRRLASLQHHVLIERDQAAVDVFDRAGDAWSVCRTIEGLAADPTQPAVGASVRQSVTYEDVLPA